MARVVNVFFCPRAGYHQTSYRSWIPVADHLQEEYDEVGLSFFGLLLSYTYVGKNKYPVI